MLKLIGFVFATFVAYGVSLFIVYLAVDIASSSQIAKEPTIIAGMAIAAAILCFAVIYAASLP